MKKLKCASVQFNHKPGDKGCNFGKIVEFVESAAAQKVDLIVFPEMHGPLTESTGREKDTRDIRFDFD